MTGLDVQCRRCLCWCRRRGPGVGIAWRENKREAGSLLVCESHDVCILRAYWQSGGAPRPHLLFDPIVLVDVGQSQGPLNVIPAYSG